LRAAVGGTYEHFVESVLPVAGASGIPVGPASNAGSINNSTDSIFDNATLITLFTVHYDLYEAALAAHSFVARERGHAMEDQRPVVTPLPERERIRSLDTLRGIALLGILVMNIRDFALPLKDFDNPAFPTKPL